MKIDNTFLNITKSNLGANHVSDEYARLLLFSPADVSMSFSHQSTIVNNHHHNNRVSMTRDLQYNVSFGSLYLTHLSPPSRLSGRTAHAQLSLTQLHCHGGDGAE